MYLQKKQKTMVKSSKTTNTHYARTKSVLFLTKKIDGGGIRPVGMQVPLLLQCLLDLVVASGPVGMQVPLLLQYLLDPSATSRSQEMSR